MSGIRNTLHKNRLEAFKQWLKERNIEMRPGKGLWQVLQVKTATDGWQCIFECSDMPEHFSVNAKLLPLVRQFIEDGARAKKCRLCGSYQFNLYQEGIDQGEMCDVHYWKVLALKGRDIAQLAWDYQFAVLNYSRACMLGDAPEVIKTLEQTMEEAFRKMNAAI